MKLHNEGVMPWQKCSYASFKKAAVLIILKILLIHGLQQVGLLSQ